jgi:GTPase Era involved in 16S rRNA processing/gas vesicle protein
MKFFNQDAQKIDQNINFLEAVIQKNFLSKKAKEDLLCQIEKIKKRRHDPYLYLAIIGEFSSGKSTLINALLRDDLLKTSALVTTATATKIIYNKKFSAEALFKTEVPKRLRVNQGNNKSHKLLTSKDVEQLFISPQQFVHVVTAEEEIARSLEDFKIYHPANFLKNGTVIIDTPGTDAINEEHGKVTQAVVAHEADAALIVIPATKPVSQSLINFLSNSIAPYIHRCVFVITKMDQIRPKEQEKLVKTIEKRLQENLNLNQLLLLESAPQIVIDMLTGEVEVGEKYRNWQNKFVEMEIQLCEYLKKGREITIIETINRLLTQVFIQFESYLKQRQEELRFKREEIKQKIILDLPSFAAEQYQECLMMLRQAVTQAKAKALLLSNNHQQEVKNKLKTKILATKTKDELISIFGKINSLLIDDFTALINTEVTNAIDEINCSCFQIKKYFDQKFLQQYQNLQPLITNANLTAKIDHLNTIQVNVSDLLNVAVQLSQTAEDRSSLETGTRVGSSTGAVVGTIIFPVVGTAIGGALGMLFGGIIGSFFSPSLSELQNQSWQELQVKIQDYFDTTDKAVKQLLDDYLQQMNQELNGHLNAYITTYYNIVEAMKQEQQQEQENLNRLQKDIQADLLEIQSRIVK